jgi:hypothetical protein
MILLNLMLYCNLFQASNSVQPDQKGHYQVMIDNPDRLQNEGVRIIQPLAMFSIKLIFFLI